MGALNHLHSGDDQDGGDLSSVSSVNAPALTFNKMIRDFKKVLAERKTPRNLVYLNRVLALILSLLIALTCVEFGLKTQFIESYNFWSQL